VKERKRPDERKEKRLSTALHNISRQKFEIRYPGNWTFRPFVSSPLDVSPPRRFAPWTYSTIPAYSVKTKVSLTAFRCFNYIGHSVRMSCWIKKPLTY